MMNTYEFLYLGTVLGYVDADSEEEASAKVLDEMGAPSDSSPIIMPVEAWKNPQS